MSLIESLKHKQIVVLGAGITGLSCARFLQASNLCFALNDSRSNPLCINSSQSDELTSTTQCQKDYPLAQVFFGRWHTELIAKADLILVSPGIDIEATGLNRYVNENCQVWGDVELFCRLNNEKQKPVPMVAVTGSNGKSTVVSLLHSMGEFLGKKVRLGGNIGQPVLDLLTERLTSNTSGVEIDLMILELSSFQLETLNSMHALGATVLNISDDHLDRHKTIENYQSIKKKIYQQTEVIITNRSDEATAFVPSIALDKKMLTTIKQVSFGSDIPQGNNFGIGFDNQNNLTLMYKENSLIKLSELKLTGIHNALNYLAALALGESAHWSVSDMVNSLNSFEGLAHRCQRIKSKDSIHWINDSKATNVGSTIAAITGIGPTLMANSKLILIAGGDGKGADFSPLKPVLAKYVSYLITLGKDGDAISALTSDSSTVTQYSVKSMPEAVKLAKQLARDNDTVLLSPACASIDMFRNFAERGELFSTEVNTQALKTLEISEKKEEL
ncbi:MAG: UDP-N-acetylmuramoyl-L-alanine--D-glutamate ligase [Colwellia sp.]